MKMRDQNGKLLPSIQRSIITILLAVVGFFAKQTYDKFTEMDAAIDDLRVQVEEYRGDIVVLATILRDKGYKIPDDLGKRKDVGK